MESVLDRHFGGDVDGHPPHPGWDPGRDRLLTPSLEGRRHGPSLVKATSCDGAAAAVSGAGASRRASRGRGTEYNMLTDMGNRAATTGTAGPMLEQEGPRSEARMKRTMKEEKQTCVT